ncbi:MAG: YihY/virulence factor BrkB family protein [Pseudomonadota bacterium]|nr:YihY/virulence factor BrkB family protein [Pseudomonadota bacterium]
MVARGKGDRSGRSETGRDAGSKKALWGMGLSAALLALGFTRNRNEAPHQDGSTDRHGSKVVAYRAHADLRQADRGRQATTPTEIPARGWKDVLWRTYEEIQSDRVVSVAAGVTFYALLAIFPAIAALVSLYGLFADPADVTQHVKSLSGVLPGGATEIIGEQLNRVASKGGGALGFAFFFGLAVSLWSANAGMKALIDALNIVYDEEEKRGFIKLNVVSLAFTLGAMLFIILALAAVVVLPAVLKLIGLESTTEWLLAILRWPLLLAGLAFWLALIYRYGPSRDTAQWRWLTAGSLFAAVTWIVGSMLFSWYVANFGSYNETYGSLGAAIGFMTWIWLSTIVILVGAEVNAEAEHQTAEDTTDGPGKPLGARGATVADSVGPSR